MHRSVLAAQSAMEYLMTYGWAILIIAVVLAALFGLGVFNLSSISPRAPPNSCRVYRDARLPSSLIWRGRAKNIYAPICHSV